MYIFPFPGPSCVTAMVETYAAINGKDSFEKEQEWEADTWRISVCMSRGKVLEKAGIGQVTMHGGQVEGIPADIQLLQPIAWPAHPVAPGFIIMASTSRMQDQPTMIMLYIDLIAQQGSLPDEEKQVLSSALSNVCSQYGQSIEEMQSMLIGRGMLGARAAECGMLYFFEESDIPFLETAVAEVLSAYRRLMMRDWGSVVDDARKAMKGARKKILDWMLTEDYGVKIARQNGIPVEIMERYAFPPA
ncbi:MAG: hypothetical protein N3B18_05150 [Desulfobacterota bacterium]|nr:hypothetical protein [Thermodesulfobacteriota bacterium]